MNKYILALAWYLQIEMTKCIFAIFVVLKKITFSSIGSERLLLFKEWVRMLLFPVI